jgi:hypothetical protein
MARTERTTIDPERLPPERRKLWEALEATSKAFEDVSLEELEREVAHSIQETREAMRREQQACEVRKHDEKDEHAPRPA